MTLNEALKVAEEAVRVRMGTLTGPTWELREQQLIDAAAALARLREELPKLVAFFKWAKTEDSGIAFYPGTADEGLRRFNEAEAILARLEEGEGT